MPRETSADRKRVCVARIGAAHGVRGEVNLWSFTADPRAVADYGPLESVEGERFEVEALRPGRGFFVARLKGIADRSAAERLNNVVLFVPRERLPSPEADEFYHADLVGLLLVDRNGVELGRVVAVQNFGAGDLLEIEPLAGGDTVLLPFTEAVAPVVDIAAGLVLANPPEGIFSKDRTCRLLRPRRRDRHRKQDFGRFNQRSKGVGLSGGRTARSTVPRF